MPWIFCCELSSLQQMLVKSLALSLCRNAAAMNFANQFLNDVKTCQCQYECFLFLVYFPFPSSFNRFHAYSSIDSPRKKWHLQTVTVRLNARRSRKNLNTRKSTLAGSRSPNVTYSAWSSHICFLLVLYRPDTSVHALNFQVRCVHYIHNPCEWK